ncbi:MAG: hypothetical protein DRJ44_00185 [Thermoprotei archaeon]|nr:MAG: hypothetical protein DRJ44_00185 [Thermoprotei archaeon]
MYKIRAITLHIKLDKSLLNIEEMIEALDFYLEKLENVSKEMRRDVEVLSKRLVLPSLEELEKKIKNFELNKLSLLEDYLKNRVNYYNLPIKGIGNPKLERELPELYSNTRRFYSSICLSMNNMKNEKTLRKIIAILKNISREAGWLAAARFAYSIGPQPLTPYFPVTSSPQTGYTISLLYVNYLLEGKSLNSENYLQKLKKKIIDVYDKIKSKASSLSSMVDLAFLGVDLSISPWLEESVVPLIEKIKDGATIGTPGTLQALYEINSILKKISKDKRVIGFNEIMLPLAEDDGLKKRVRERDLELKDLVMYCLACVAGLDMVPIPEWTEDKVLMLLFKDLSTISIVGKKTLGVRLLPVGVEAGEEVDLGEFGKTPVLDVL